MSIGIKKYHSSPQRTYKYLSFLRIAYKQVSKTARALHLNVFQQTPDNSIFRQTPSTNKFGSPLHPKKNEISAFNAKGKLP